MPMPMPIVWFCPIGMVIRESHYAGYDAPGRNTYRIM
jgi:hypothetical protein